MTSNVGAREIKKSGGFGFASDAAGIDFTKMRDKIMEEVKRLFNPEFVNRVDEIVVFHPLKKEHMEEIVDIVIDEMLSKVSDRQIEIKLTKGAKDYLIDKGFDEAYGARPLKRTIQKYIEDEVAEEILHGTFDDGSVIQVKRKGDGLEYVELERKEIVKKGSADSSQDPKKEKTEEIG